MVGRTWETALVKCRKDIIRSFLSRKAGILKKAQELSVLCRTQVAVVIFGPDKDTPHVWPPRLEDLHSIIGRYLNLYANQNSQALSSSDVSENIEDGDELKDEEGTEVAEENKGKKNDLVNEFGGFSVTQLTDLVGNVDAKLAIVNSRIAMMKRAPRNPFEDGCYTLQCDSHMMNNSLHYQERPLPFNFEYSVENHDANFGGSCDSFFGDFSDCVVGAMRNEESIGSSPFFGVAPW